MRNCKTTKFLKCKLLSKKIIYVNDIYKNWTIFDYSKRLHILLKTSPQICSPFCLFVCFDIPLKRDDTVCRKFCIIHIQTPEKNIDTLYSRAPKFTTFSGADPGFQVRRGALKKIAASGGRREIIGVFRVKNHDFTPKNHIIFNCRGRRENFGVFRVKNHDFFSNFRGGARRGRPPPP
jgi:hypothetical protein